MRSTRSTSRLRHAPATGPRRGVALAVALMAIVLIGALAAGTFYASTQEYRIGRNALYEPRAMAVAEAALNARLAILRDTPETTAAAGSVRTYPTYTSVATTGSTDEATVRLTRLSTLSYLLTAEGKAGGETDAKTVRRTSVLLRYARPTFNFLGAVTVRDTIKVGGSSVISGNDTRPAGWSDCPALAASMPGVVTPTAAMYQTNGNPAITGNPPNTTDPAAADTNQYFKYGSDADWKTLVAMADITLPTGYTGNPAPVVASGSCVASNDNWGEPNRTVPASPCETRFPIIYWPGPGTFSVQNGRGQGVLLIDGDLKVTGNFEFDGVVIVRGHFNTAGTGNHLTGALMSAGADVGDNSVLGNAVVSYSRCAVEHAAAGAAAYRSVGGRSWSAVY